MTLIVGWLACDQRGPCSAYIASDSRISDNRNFYDYSQKTFALKNTPDILGYCGETLFTYQILTRLTSMCDVGMLLSADMDYQDRSGKKEYDENFLRFKNGNNESTSRNYFHCFCDIVKNVKDKHTGGIPQLVGLYNGSKFNGMYHGTIVDGQAYYQGLKMGNVYGMSNIRWYNENFEICDWNTKQREANAMVQPISKKATP